MASAAVKDDTPDSLTKGKQIVLPSTLLECPPIKIFSVRFYKYNKVVKDVLSDGLDKELKRKVKIPKKKGDIDSIKPEDYDDIAIIAYSVVKKTNVKKTPDLVEIGLSGSVEEKLKFVKENMGKEMSALDFFEVGKLVDVRGLTKGKGYQGPVKRFGVTLRVHKSEKGQRKVGSIGPWHPARVTFRVPMAGQVGMFTRAIYNKTILSSGKAEDNKFLKNIKNYGDIKTDYLVVSGSVMGSAKRQLVLTAPLRKTKKQEKKAYSFVELR